MPTRGRFVCHVHCLVHDGAVRSSPCGPHHESFRWNLYHMFVSAYFTSQSFVFDWLWYLSCFNDKCVSIPFLSGILMWIPILLDLRIFHLNFFWTGVSLFKWIRSFSTSARSTQVFSMLFVSSVPSCLCFPALPPFLFNDSYIWIKYSSYGCEVSSLFPSMFLSGDSHEDTNGTSSLSFLVLLSSPVDSIQAFGVWSYSFPYFNAFSCRCNS